MSYTRYVAGFVFSASRRRVLLIEKQRPSWQRTRLNGIGGAIKEHEEPRYAMTRELQEEAGVHVAPSAWRHVATLDFPAGCVLFFDVCDDHAFNNAQTQLVRNDAGVDVERLYRIWVDELRDYECIPNLHYLIPLCVHCTSALSGSRLALPVLFIEVSA